MELYRPGETVTPRLLYTRWLIGRQRIRERIRALLADQEHEKAYIERNLCQDRERLALVEDYLSELRRQHGERLWEGGQHG